MTTSDLEHSSDGELIAQYIQHRGASDEAMRELVGRHNEVMYARFLAKVRNESDANDLQQELWSRVARSLHRYQDEEKFSHYLSKLASNVLIDFYRKSGRDKDVFADQSAEKYSEDFADDQHDSYLSSYEDASQNTEQNTSNSELIQHLIGVLIPGLPVEQRAAWLLRHEAEYWEPSRPFEWRHLAELNNVSEAEANSVFETARNKLMVASVAGKSAALEELELLVFLVWTQAQRWDKSKNFTWDYFSELLGQPVNTMKTRYRTAQKALEKGLKEYLEA